MKNFYELRYTHDSKEIVHRFQAEIDKDEMYYCIREFLLGCSWHPETVNKIIGKDE